MVSNHKKLSIFHQVLQDRKKELLKLIEMFPERMEYQFRFKEVNQLFRNYYDEVDREFKKTKKTNS